MCVCVCVGGGGGGVKFSVLILHTQISVYLKDIRSTRVVIVTVKRQFLLALVAQKCTVNVPLYLDVAAVSVQNQRLPERERPLALMIPFPLGVGEKGRWGGFTNHAA